MGLKKKKKKNIKINKEKKMYSIKILVEMKPFQFKQSGNIYYNFKYNQQSHSQDCILWK